MKEIKHTPGPWSYDPDTHEIESGFGLVSTLANEGRGIAQDEEGLANAGLITAAPELLEAAKKTIEDWPGDEGAFPALESAIAKAESRPGT